MPVILCCLHNDPGRKPVSFPLVFNVFSCFTFPVTDRWILLKAYSLTDTPSTHPTAKIEPPVYKNFPRRCGSCTVFFVRGRSPLSHHTDTRKKIFRKTIDNPIGLQYII